MEKRDKLKNEEVSISDYVKESDKKFSNDEKIPKDNKLNKNRKIKKEKKKKSKIKILISIIILIILVLYGGLIVEKQYKKASTYEEMEKFPVISYTTPVVEQINGEELTNKVAQKEDVNKVIGYIEIPSVELKEPILQGKSNNDPYEALKVGVAHDPTTVLPGESNKGVFLGHRENVFKRLQYVQKGDLVILTIGENIYLYEVTYTGKVNENMAGVNRVFKETDDDTITLYTCYPFKKLSKITGRWIVEAKRVPEYDKEIVKHENV